MSSHNRLKPITGSVGAYPQIRGYAKNPGANRDRFKDTTNQSNYLPGF